MGNDLKRVSGLTFTILTESSIALSNDQGANNYSPIKKYFYKDGLHAMTSISTITYELRKRLIKEYGWMPSDMILDFKKEKKLNKIVPSISNIQIENEEKKCLENDVFGFLLPDKQLNKTSPLRIIPLISVNTYKSDTQIKINKGLLEPDFNRKYFDEAGKEIQVSEIPKTQALAFEEVHGDYYYYTVTIELERIGVVEVEEGKYLEPSMRKYMDKAIRKQAVKDLVEAFTKLTRDIKHGKVLLKPLAIFGGAFESPIPYFWNDVCIDKSGNLNLNYVKETIEGYSLNEDEYIIAISSRIQTNSNEIKISEKTPQQTMNNLVERLIVDEDNYWYLMPEDNKNDKSGTKD